MGAVAGTLGWHWILDAQDCDAAALPDRATLLRALAEVPDALGLTRVGQPQVFAHHEDAGGPAGADTLAGITLLAESHFSLHLRPALRTLHADLFSCAPFAPDRAREVLHRLYRPGRSSEQVLTRGGGVA